MVSLKQVTPLLFVLLLIATGCENKKDDAACISGMGNLAPTVAASLKIDAGKITRFHAEPLTCDPTRNYGIRWILDDEVVAYANDYDYIACNEDEGTHRLAAQAITYTTTDDATLEEVVFEHQWAITVNGVSRPERPTCYDQSISDVKTATFIDADHPEEVSKLADAVSCLDGYLETYACDFPAAYASGLAKTALFGEQLYSRVTRRAEMTLDEVEDIANNEVEPIRKNFLVIHDKAPDDFSFNVSGFFKLKAFTRDNSIPWSDDAYIQLGGRHDKSEALFILTIMGLFNGGLNIGLANTGAIEFALKTPDDETPVSGSERVIKSLEGDARFLTFIDQLDENGEVTSGGEGKEGRRLMGNAQNNFIQTTVMASGLFDRIRSETHDQAQDILRYWDCGKDAVCPASCPYSVEYFNLDNAPDPAERNGGCVEDQWYSDRNMNNKCDEAWAGPDTGECNQKYDEGEVIGVQRLSWSKDSIPTRDGPSLEIDKIQAILGIIRDNLRGPDYLDFDKIVDILEVQLPTSVALLMEGAGIPYPKVRLSQFFLTPSPIRDLVPLYSKSKKQFILDLESEPFDDFGYDGLISQNEPGYDRLTNPDPHRDDLDPYCNPECNQDDYIDVNDNGEFNAGIDILVDNDGDGLANNADKKDFAPKDLGVEGNFVFDFIDMPDSKNNYNGIHDPGEPHEKFQDVGTYNVSRKLIGKGNGKWDWADRAHEWPTGNDIGPVSNLDRAEDPANGSLAEQPEGLQDPYYYFLQDPTFSGVVDFVKNPTKPGEPIVNAQGKELTENAKLQRFISVIMKLAADLGFREANAHPCKLGLTAEQCNHWSDKSQGYQP